MASRALQPHNMTLWSGALLQQAEADQQVIGEALACSPVLLDVGSSLAEVEQRRGCRDVCVIAVVAEHGPARQRIMRRGLAGSAEPLVVLRAYAGVAEGAQLLARSGGLVRSLDAAQLVHAIGSRLRRGQRLSLRLASDAALALLPHLVLSQALCRLDALLLVTAPALSPSLGTTSFLYA